MPTPDTRARIKGEATRLFVARGVDAVSVRDIAAAVGMKAPNLYAHFASRDALIGELFAEGYAAYGALLAEAAAAGANFADRLDRMIRLICRLHDEDTTRFRFLLLTQHGSLTAVDADAPDNPVAFLQGRIAAAMRAGEVPTRDPALVAAMIVGIVVQTATFLLYGRLRGCMGEHAGALCRAAQALAMQED